MKALSFLIPFSLFILNGCDKDESTVSLPKVTTAPIIDITPTSGKCGGEVISDGGSPVTSRGVCWSANQSPIIDESKTTDGSVIGEFESSITGLEENTTYYVRAYATNSEGTSYGEQMIFITATAPVTDIDGNVYNTVAIDAQIWMKENLKTTKLNDNTLIPNVTDNAEWSSLSTPGYCHYDNDELTNKDVYGALYNWYAVNTDKLCPSGWHVPTDAEWTTLTTFLGGENVAGGKLKETGFTHWSSPNTGATNELNFNALPGGYRTPTSLFYDLNYACRWWSSTEASATSSWERGLYYELTSVNRGEGNNLAGYSVRCIKD